MSAIVPFDFQGSLVRVVSREGEPWFVASDVARLLGYRDANKATRLLDDDERGTRIVGTPYGDQEMSVINESGLFAIVLRSRRPEAKTFRRWVTSEVLPAIRRTGRYEARPTREVENSVPLPSSRLKYPFRQMAVGQSFAVPFPPGGRLLVYNRVRAVASYHQAVLGCRFVTRTVGTEIRVWRAA